MKEVLKEIRDKLIIYYQDNKWKLPVIGDHLKSAWGVVRTNSKETDDLVREAVSEFEGGYEELMGLPKLEELGNTPSILTSNVEKIELSKKQAKEEIDNWVDSYLESRPDPTIYREYNVDLKKEYKDRQLDEVKYFEEIDIKYAKKQLEFEFYTRNHFYKFEGHDGINYKKPLFSFSNEEELLNHPYMKKYSEMEGFITFERNPDIYSTSKFKELNRILAIIDGSCWFIGNVENVDDFEMEVYCSKKWRRYEKSKKEN